jgi:hypothetical protein
MPVTTMRTGLSVVAELWSVLAEDGVLASAGSAWVLDVGVDEGATGVSVEIIGAAVVGVVVDVEAEGKAVSGAGVSNVTGGQPLNNSGRHA